MVILIDGDGCPGLMEIKEIAKYHSIEMIVFVDYAHLIQDDYFEVVFCEIGVDSVDQAIVDRCKKGDLVISQDYGLASLVLLRGAGVLHPSGKIITNDNIDQLLMDRYFASPSIKITIIYNQLKLSLLKNLQLTHLNVQP